MERLSPVQIDTQGGQVRRLEFELYAQKTVYKQYMKQLVEVKESIRECILRRSLQQEGDEDGTEELPTLADSAS